MKRSFLSFMSLLCAVISFSQSPDDVLRYTYFPQKGSARNMAIGGAMGSLGGDINALYVNPAGLGFYKTNEFIISPGFLSSKNKFNYRGTDTMNDKSVFDFGTTGVVGYINNPRSKWASQAISLAITQTANFNNHISYSGLNNQSSFAEQFAEQFSSSGASAYSVLNDPLYSNIAPSFYSYLIDTFPNGSGGYNIKALPEFLLANGGAVKQQKTIDTRGGIYEIGLGYAANMDDKLFLGGSVGIPILNYSHKMLYRESDAGHVADTMFNYFEYADTFSTKGVGINLKLGMIFKPADFIRLGLAIHTPTFYSLTDRQSTGITTDLDKYTGTVIHAYSRFFNNNAEARSKYLATTPWKLIASGSYVFREVGDTRKQRGFISTDVEYVRYRSYRFHSDNESTAADDSYYKGLKDVIRDYYKGAFNFRAGGELKFNTIMFRLGGAYYGNPYSSNTGLTSSIKQLSGGLGYRNHGFFVDLTYARYFTEDANFPYRLEDKPNTYAVQKTQRGNVMLTFGCKF